jgi:phosphonate degradation associated HDIG domain protein
MTLSVEQIVHVLESRGGASYGGEAVTRLEHALQCAQLAEQAGSTPELIAACLLHDLGHLLAPRGDGDESPDADDVHQYLAIPFLRGLFADAVLDPIQLHVDAKRYLCRTDPAYWEALSPASKHSLELQGGVFDVEGAQAFLQLPHAEDAILLRHWDDLAKVPDRITPPLAHYASVMRKCALVAVDEGA